MLSILAWGRVDDGDNGDGGRRGWIKTHSKHKNTFDLSHQHEHGSKTLRYLKKRDWREYESRDRDRDADAQTE